MNTELVDHIANYVVKLSIAKAILHNESYAKAKIIIKDLTNMDIDQLKQQLKEFE